MSRPGSLSKFLPAPRPPVQYATCPDFNLVSPFPEELTVTSGKLISHCILNLHLCYIYNAPIKLMSALEDLPAAGPHCQVDISHLDGGTIR
jgi:hypothetical protein